jgi:hypothetical protein
VFKIATIGAPCERRVVKQAGKFATDARVCQCAERRVFVPPDARQRPQSLTYDAKGHNGAQRKRVRHPSRLREQP